MKSSYWVGFISLAFDLFIGRYVWLRMLSTKRPIYVSTPILILCTLMAPLGFLLGLLATWQHNEVERDSVMNHGK